MFIFHHRFFQFVGLACLGGLFSLAFAPWYLVILVLPVLALLFLSLNRALYHRSAFIRGFAFGFGFGAVSTGWLRHAILLGGDSLIWVVPLVWLGMGILFGLFWGLPACLASFFPTGSRRLIAWASLMTLFEWIRSWFLTGFPWNLVGSVWEDTLPILQSAAVWGVYGLTFFTLITGASLVLYPRKKPIFLAITAFILVYAYGSERLYNATDATIWGVRLRLVQPNIPQTLKWDPQADAASFSKLMHLSRHDNGTITHVIWPESAVSFFVNGAESDRLPLMQAIRQGGTLILGGLRRLPSTNRAAANSLFVLDDLAHIITFYDKSHLVPFGEYVPLRQLLPFDKIVPLGYDFTAGDGVQTLRIPKTPHSGACIDGSWYVWNRS